MNTLFQALLPIIIGVALFLASPSPTFAFAFAFTARQPFVSHHSAGIARHQHQQQPSSSFSSSSFSSSRLYHNPEENDDIATTITTSSHEAKVLFPVLHQLAGKEWTGVCRYVNAELLEATNLELVGGLKYELLDQIGGGFTCKLSTFLTFPNGKTREVVMKGTKSGSTTDSATDSTTDSTTTRRPMRLDAAEAKPGEVGPIYMTVAEIGTDTVLINEIETATGQIIMTSSISIIVSSSSGDDNNNKGKEMELVQVTHEVGAGAGGTAGSTAIEGHQVWRLKQN